MKLAEFKKQWQNIDKIKCFEIPVINILSDETDYIIFNIQLIGRSFVAQHEGLTNRQIKSKYISCVKSVIDLDFSLNDNLQNLYYACHDAINKSTLFIAR